LAVCLSVSPSLHLFFSLPPYHLVTKSACLSVSLSLCLSVSLTPCRRRSDRSAWQLGTRERERECERETNREGDRARPRKKVAVVEGEQERERQRERETWKLSAVRQKRLAVGSGIDFPFGICGKSSAFFESACSFNTACTGLCVNSVFVCLCVSDVCECVCMCVREREHVCMCVFSSPRALST